MSGLKVEALQREFLYNRTRIPDPAVSVPVKTTVTDVPVIWPSIHFCTVAMSFFLTASHAATSQKSRAFAILRDPAISYLTRAPNVTRMMKTKENPPCHVASLYRDGPWFIGANTQLYRKEPSEIHIL